MCVGLPAETCPNYLPLFVQRVVPPPTLRKVVTLVHSCIQCIFECLVPEGGEGGQQRTKQTLAQPRVTYIPVGSEVNG